MQSTHLDWGKLAEAIPEDKGWSSIWWDQPTYDTIFITQTTSAHSNQRVWSIMAYLELCLPADFNDIDAHSIGDNEQRQVSNVGRRKQKLRGFLQSHSLFLLLRGSLALFCCLGLRDDIILNVLVSRQHHTSRSNHASHQISQGDSPGINARCKTGSHIRHIANELSRKD